MIDISKASFSSLARSHLVSFSNDRLQRTRLSRKRVPLRGSSRQGLIPFREFSNSYKPASNFPTSRRPRTKVLDMTHEFYHERDESLRAAYDVLVCIAKIDKRNGKFINGRFSSILFHELLQAARRVITLSSHPIII